MVDRRSTSAEAQAPTSASAALLVRFWWLFPLLLLTAAVVTAVLNRERPLTLVDAAPEAAASLQAIKHAPPAELWSAVRLRSNRTFRLSSGRSFDSNVSTSWQALTPGIYRRSDDWYDVGGSRPRYEERSVTWLGLVGLRWLEREPAPLFHDVLANQGWLGERTVRAEVLEVSDDFPLLEGSRIVIRTTRQPDKRPIASNQGLTSYQRLTRCLAGRPEPGAVVHASLGGEVIPVHCSSRRSEHTASEAIEAGSSSLVFSKRLGIYLPLEHREREPRSPFEADDTPPRWSTTTYRYQEVAVVR